jgi:hypothetical protein
MPANRDHYTNVLKFWRSVETFALPDIPSPSTKSDNKVHTVLRAPALLPWDSDEWPAAPEGKQWRHTLYCNIVPKEAVVSVLAQLTGSDEYREPVYGYTCLSAVVLDHTGRPSERGYTPAGFMYGIRVIREGKDPEALGDLLRKAQEQYLVRFGLSEKDALPKTVDWKTLQKELDVLGELGNDDVSVLCVSEIINVGTGSEAPFLNSYYLNDLNTLINDIGGIGKALEVVLSPSVDIAARRDLLDQRVLLEALHPSRLSPGRWPSSPESGLYSAQQAAVNLAMSGLGEASPLVGINGPPGTGKTTLLREVIADVIVSRARRILKAKVTALFSDRAHTIVDKTGYYKIEASVFGNDGIVVSSNNNTAIENISKALPTPGSIDLSSFGDAEYFSGIATAIGAAPCWGMLSAVLGKAENRNSFISRFWFNKGKGFGKYLQEFYDDHTCLKKYEETAEELRNLLSEYDKFRQLVSEYHDLLLSGGGPRIDKLRDLLITEYGMPANGLPDMRFFDLPMEVIHRMTPYSCLQVNVLRSKIFLLSLELHEWAIKVNARKFSRNLNAFIDMLSNKHLSFIDAGIAAGLWNSFFFCIPVVSVTLASFQRQFPAMGQGSIGWLLLDEAGQATPAAVCGAIWRSNKCIIIGDTMQIPPVVTIPAALEQLLLRSYSLSDETWGPSAHSAQFLADRVTVHGTGISQDGSLIWTSIPLRAHRRCSEPMFSISNHIAYNGQMVRVIKDAVSDIPTGESSWIDVQGFNALEGHAIVEELQVVEDMLLQLAHFTGMIYIISPFRSVAEICRQQFYVRDRVACGTIHTFQGKEAEIVFLVLGTLPGSVQARNWVAQAPNMLNVAVTRAKERLYVIGNRGVWGRHRYFSYLAGQMVVGEHRSGRLF